MCCLGPDGSSYGQVWVLLDRMSSFQMTGRNLLWSAWNLPTSAGKSSNLSAHANGSIKTKNTWRWRNDFFCWLKFLKRSTAGPVTALRLFRQDKLFSSHWFSLWSPTLRSSVFRTSKRSWNFWSRNSWLIAFRFNGNVICKLLAATAMAATASNSTWTSITIAAVKAARGLDFRGRRRGGGSNSRYVHTMKA